MELEKTMKHKLLAVTSLLVAAFITTDAYGQTRSDCGGAGQQSAAMQQREMAAARRQQAEARRQAQEARLLAAEQRKAEAKAEEVPEDALAEDSPTDDDLQHDDSADSGEG